MEISSLRAVKEISGSRENPIHSSAGPLHPSPKYSFSVPRNPEWETNLIELTSAIGNGTAQRKIWNELARPNKRGFLLFALKIGEYETNFFSKMIRIDLALSNSRMIF